MNDNQVNALVLGVLKIAGAALAAHGFTTASTFVGLPATAQDVTGIVLAIIGLLGSHLSSGSNPPPSGTARPVVAVLLGGVLIGALFGVTGCASAPTNIYKAVGTTDATVQAALTAWDAYYVANPTIPISEVEQVRAAFEKVQAAELTVLDADAVYAQYTGTNAPASVIANSSAAAANATATLGDLVALLSQFGIKL